MQITAETELKIAEIIQRMTPLLQPDVDCNDPRVQAIRDLEIPAHPQCEISITDDDGSEFDDVPEQPGSWIMEDCWGRDVLTIRMTELDAFIVDPVNDQILDAILELLRSFE